MWSVLTPTPTTSSVVALHRNQWNHILPTKFRTSCSLRDIDVGNPNSSTPVFQHDQSNVMRYPLCFFVLNSLVGIFC